MQKMAYCAKLVSLLVWVVCVLQLCSCGMQSVSVSGKVTCGNGHPGKVWVELTDIDRFS